MDNNYSQYFSEDSLWDKLKRFGKQAGAKVVYVVLLLYYTMSDKNVGVKTKLSIAAALGYFILPTDAIFDLTPFIGYSDDLGVLLFVLTAIGKNITPEIKQKAKDKLNEWFGEVPPEELKEIDDKTK
jgi:uncharacterized membrane protein YkvA (DUF1232 family)